MVYAALEGIAEKSQLHAENESVGRLPLSLEEAADCAEDSDFVKKYIPANILNAFISHSSKEWKEYSSAYDKEAFEEKTYFYSL